MKKIAKPIFILMFLGLITLVSISKVEACCKHIGNVGPTGGGVGFWGYVYLNQEVVAGAIVTASRHGRSIAGCTYLGNGQGCSSGVSLLHTVEEFPYHAIEFSQLIEDVRGPDGLPTEPVTFDITVTYTDPNTNIQYEVTEQKTLSAEDFNEYKEVRLDISLYNSEGTGLQNPVQNDFPIMENTYVDGTSAGIDFPSQLAQSFYSSMSLNQTAFVNPTVLQDLPTTPSWLTNGENLSDQYGHSVSAAGDVNCDGYGDVIVSAPYYPVTSGGTGKIYVLHGGPNGLSLQPDWYAEARPRMYRFGLQVSTAGDFNGDGCGDILVSTPDYTNGQANEGWVAVYEGSPTGLGAPNRQPFWEMESNSSQTRLGAKIGSAGDVNGDGFDDILIVSGIPQFTIIYGAYSDLAVTFQSKGIPAVGNTPKYSANYVGDVNGDGYTDILITYSATTNTQENGFGLFLGSENKLPQDPSHIRSYYGSGFTNHYVGDVNHDGYDDFIRYSVAQLTLWSGRATDGWSNTALWTYSIDGYLVVSSGDINGDGFTDLIIKNGSPSRFQVFYGKVTGFDSSPNWTSPLFPNQAIQSLNYAGDVNGDGYSDFITGLFGSPETNPDSAVVFHGSARHPVLSNWFLAGGTNEQTGYASQTVGDINQDGYVEVGISAPEKDSNGLTNNGSVLLYPGSQNGLSSSNNPSETLTGTTSNERFGSALAGNIDIDGNGCTDMVVGAPGFNSNQGKIVMYLNQCGTLDTNNPISLLGPNGATFYGQTITNLGDINGDGLGDFAVGAPNGDLVHIFLGNTNTNLLTPISLSGPLGSKFGSAIVGAGDVNGDGLHDILIGGPEYHNGQFTVGGVWLYKGSWAGVETTPIWAGVGQDNSKYGSALTLGDLNGDGFSDIVVGAYQSGIIYPYLGSPNTIIAREAIQLTIGQEFGKKVQSGDFNNDGYQDIAVSAPLYSVGATNRGAIYFFYGSQTGLNSSRYGLTVGSGSNYYLGQALGAGGDINGDGYLDLMVGSPVVGNTAGRAYLIWGNGGDGNTLNLRQFKLGGEPLPPFATVEHYEGVECEATGGPLIVSSTLQLACEFVPIYETFEESENLIAVYSEVVEKAGPNTTVRLTVTDLLAGVVYKWRARWIYEPGNFMGQRYSPWFSPAWNGQTEGDWRTTMDNIGATIIAPTEAPAGVPVTIGASTLPLTVTLPIQYEWNIPGYGTFIHTSGLTDTVTITPHTVGNLGITLKVTSGSGEQITTHKYVQITPYLTGFIISKEITPTITTGTGRLDDLVLQTTVPDQTILQVEVLDDQLNPIGCVAPTELQDGINKISLACINLDIYPSIRFKVTFTTNQPQITPLLTKWGVNWLEIGSPVHKIAGQVKDGYGYPVANAQVTHIISGTEVAQTVTNARGWYEFDTVPNPREPHNVRVSLHDGNNDYAVQHMDENGVYVTVALESYGVYSNSPYTIFSTKIVNVDFLDHQEVYSSNIPEAYRDRLDDLAAIYRHSQEAVWFIRTELEEDMEPFTILAYDPATGSANYDEPTASINLGIGYSVYTNANRPMNREWHEIFHHLMAHQIGSIPIVGMTYCNPPNPFQNHGGYWNICTSDSWSEGWAVFWSTVLSDQLRWQKPGAYHMGYNRRLGEINLEVDYKAWSGHCNVGLIGFECYQREEFAVGSTLWELYDDQNDHRDRVYVPLNELWAILKQNHLHDMKDVYDAFVLAGIGQTNSQTDSCDLNDLDEIFVAHGFFHDENEDKKHQCGEEVGRAANGMIYPRSDRRATPAMDNKIELTTDVVITGSITATIVTTFAEHPEWNYSYEALVVNNEITIEPPPTDYPAQIRIEVYSNDGRRSTSTSSFTLSNEEYWLAFAQSQPNETVFSHEFEMKWIENIPMIYR